jgi:hypothetical protein
MWHAALDEVVRHEWHADTPSFGTGIVTISVPVVPRPNDPLYLALVEKVRRMTHGVDASGNEDPNGKKFLFTAAAGNFLAGPIDWCRTFPTVRGRARGDRRAGRVARPRVDHRRRSL